MNEHNDGRRTDVAILAGGCFWCLEAVFDDLRGVESVENGYIGGAGRDPYEAVCSGTSRTRRGRAHPLRRGRDQLHRSYWKCSSRFTIQRP